jgi:hypothetical protein
MAGLQTWIATGPSRVSIPFAHRLAELVPPVAVRLRRDFKTVLMLIRAHAKLHQASRRRDEDGRIIAQIQDYVVVRELIADLVAVGVDATVKPEVREVVRAASALIEKGQQEVRQSELKSALQLDKSAISRRVADALDGGFLKNLEDRKGCPARLIIGEALPDNQEVLPSYEQLFGGDGLRSCRVDPGGKPPPPPPSGGQEVLLSKPSKAHRPRPPDGRQGCERSGGSQVSAGCRQKTACPSRWPIVASTLGASRSITATRLRMRPMRSARTRIPFGFGSNVPLRRGPSCMRQFVCEDWRCA